MTHRVQSPFKRSGVFGVTGKIGAAEADHKNKLRSASLVTGHGSPTSIRSISEYTTCTVQKQRNKGNKSKASFKHIYDGTS